MNSSSLARSTARRPRPVSPAASPLLSWIHDGVRYRVGLWPEAVFQRESSPGRWTAIELSEEAAASAALGVTGNQWRAYLEFVPAAVREFLERFQFSRMAALQVLARCPDLLADLSEQPALVPFLHAHRALRGGTESGWAEISAVFE